MTTIATAFNTLPLSAAMLANLDSLGYAQMTPIQAQSLPVILKGMDLIAQAKTGSGKTAAFGIGLLNPINPRLLRLPGAGPVPDPRAGRPGRQGNPSPGPCRRQHQGPDPVRRRVPSARRSLRWNTARTSSSAPRVVSSSTCAKVRWCSHGLNTLILDEADRMLDMGFYDSIEEIIVQAPERRQTLLFSATYPVGIKQLASKFMRNPQQVKAEAFHDDTQIEQRFYEISPEERMSAVTKVLAPFPPGLLRGVLLHQAAGSGNRRSPDRQRHLRRRPARRSGTA